VLIPCIDLQGGQAVQLVHGRRRELAVRDVFGLLDKFQINKWLHIIFNFAPPIGPQGHNIPLASLLGYPANLPPRRLMREILLVKIGCWQLKGVPR